MYLQVVTVKVGESVFGRQTMERMVQGRGGACGEWCVVDAANIAPKPTNITHEHAAAVPTASSSHTPLLQPPQIPPAPRSAGARRSARRGSAICGVGLLARRLAARRWTIRI